MASKLLMVAAFAATSVAATESSWMNTAAVPDMRFRQTATTNVRGHAASRGKMALRSRTGKEKSGLMKFVMWNGDHPYSGGSVDPKDLVMNSVHDPQNTQRALTDYWDSWWFVLDTNTKLINVYGENPEKPFTPPKGKEGTNEDGSPMHPLRKQGVYASFDLNTIAEVKGRDNANGVLSGGLAERSDCSDDGDDQICCFTVKAVGGNPWWDICAADPDTRDSWVKAILSVLPPVVPGLVGVAGGAGGFAAMLGGAGGAAGGIGGAGGSSVQFTNSAGQVQTLASSPVESGPAIDCSYQPSPQAGGSTWTECSLECGGGVTRQYYVQVPAQNGGKPCDPSHQKFDEKPCNEQACDPTVVMAAPVVLPPSYVTEIDSVFPTAVTPCTVIKSYLQLVSEDTTKNPPAIQQADAIVTMTPMALTVYERGNVDPDTSLPEQGDIISTLSLNSLMAAGIDPTKRECFRIGASHGGSGKSVKLCATTGDGEHSKEELATLFVDTFKAFNGKECKEDAAVDELRADLDSKIKASVRNFKIVYTEQEMGEADEQKNIDEAEQEEEQEEEKAAILKQQALRRRKLVVQEAQNAQLKKLKEKSKKLEDVVEKEECLKREMLAKEELGAKIEKELEIKDEEAEEDEKNKQELAQEVVEEKAKIADINKRGEAALEMADNKLQEKQRELAETAMAELADGDCNHCMEAKSSLDTIKEYCTTKLNAVEKVQENICSQGTPEDPTKFCDVCASNEFGSAKFKERTECAHKCAEKLGLYVYVPDKNAAPADDKAASDKLGTAAQIVADPKTHTPN